MADEPKLPDDAGLVQAVTDAEKAAQSAFLTWAAEYTDWGRALKVRAQRAKAWCDKAG